MANCAASSAPGLRVRASETMSDSAPTSAISATSAGEAAPSARRRSRSPDLIKSTLTSTPVWRVNSFSTGRRKTSCRSVYKLTSSAAARAGAMVKMSADKIAAMRLIFIAGFLFGLEG